MPPSTNEPTGCRVDTERQDVIICIYAYSRSYPEINPFARDPKVEDVLWDAASRPLIVELSPKSPLPSPSAVKDCDGNIVGWSVIKSIIGSQLGGKAAGRIALIGFSAGCNQVQAILNGSAAAKGVAHAAEAAEYDRKILDTVVMLDGMAGDAGIAFGESPGLSPSSVSKLSLYELTGAPRGSLKYALSCAEPDPVTGVPSHCMVVTCTNIINPNTASTRAMALRLVQEVESRASAVAPPCLVPNGLIGTTGPNGRPIAAEDKPGETWPSAWNTCNGVDSAGFCYEGIVEDWPVDYSKIMGNLIVVGFNAHGERNKKESNFQPGHMFQSYWVHQRVWKDVLKPRWEKVCDHVEQLPPESPTGEAQLRSLTFRAIAPPPSKSNPNTLIRRGRLTKTLVKQQVAGLGEVTSECGIDGVIADILSPSDILLNQIKTYVVPAGLAVGAVLLFKYFYDRR